MPGMRRREFVTLLGGAAARIGIIDEGPAWDHFRFGLRDLGYIEGRNIVTEYRSAEGNVARLTRAALELAAPPVNVIVAYGSTATRAARQATSTIPIVMIAIGDPVRAGFVTNLARPGGNMTGNSILGPEQPAKFELTINLRTAKTLDLELPPTLLALADQVIE
jgi:putative tryptophan/tyrosine transport system substrate-binding protein